MSETRCKIRPTNWTEVVIANVDDDTWDARYTDPKTRLEWTFPYGTYECVEVLDSEPEPVDERPPCVCDLKVTWGCVCAHMDGRRYRAAY